MTGHIQYSGYNEEEANEAGHSVMDDHSSDEDELSDELRRADPTRSRSRRSSSPSVPDEDIDFEHVYALHNFMATVEGQASVSKGDSLTLLDDSNSYWWLVRVLKTQAVGYIPAENIETPFERLARLNKHRNVDDHAHGAGSAAARTKIGNRPPKPKPRIVPGQPKTRIAFREENEIFEHSGDDWSVSYEDSEEMAEFEGQEGFEDDEEAEETSEDEDPDETLTNTDHLSLDQQLSQQYEAEEAERRRQAAQAQAAAQIAARPAPAVQIQTHDPRARSPVNAPADMLAAAGTRKIVLTPPVAQDDDSSQGHGSPSSPRKLRKNSKDDDVSSDRVVVTSPSPSPSSPTNDEDGKKKKGGILSGLFKKKDKKAKDGVEDRDTTPTGRVQSPTGNSPAVSPSITVRPAWPADQQQQQQQQQQQRRGDSYMADATRRQQQIEAQHARETSGARLPAAQMVSLSPASNLSPNTSYASSQNSPLVPGRPPRPGSLIGSPSMTGIEVPMLSVMRVFAGTGINSDSTFKTVLINGSTTTSDLVRQAVQRFRLPIDRVDDFFLTVRELGGDENKLSTDQSPLQVFEKLTERGLALPSVRRSSIGSISSIASNLSLNPAIAKLGMQDYSDDSNVKFYIHSRQSEPGKPPSSPSLRFAIRTVIYPPDLPDGVMYDPQSQSLVLRMPDPSSPVEVKERILFFPANANVAEVIETCLDKFGITGGVVEGGDEVEDKLAKRRSITRVRYSLAAMRGGRQTVLAPSMRILDAYDSSPQFKQSDRSSKDYKRRSTESSLLYGTPADLLPTDPVFVLRNAALIAASRDRLAAAAAQDGPKPHRPSQVRAPSTNESVYATPSEELPPQLVTTPSSTGRGGPKKQVITAQKNAAQGVDIKLPDRGTIRSSKPGGRGVRYSYITEDGAEQDISEIVEAEFAANAGGQRTASRQQQTPRSASSVSSNDQFVTPESSPIESDREDQAAIEALRSTPLTIGESTPRADSRGSGRRDVLEAALNGPTAEETLEARINRVLSRVKTGGGLASALRQGGGAGGGGRTDTPDSEASTPTSPRTPAGTSQTSPATRAGSSRQQRPILYRDDYGLDVLMTLIDAEVKKPTRIPEPGLDELLGPSIDETTKKWYRTDSIEALESRLDDVLASVLA